LLLKLVGMIGSTLATGKIDEGNLAMNFGTGF
jgi:hypothetical protein